MKNKKSKMELEIMSYFDEMTLRRISQITKINLTRVFRLRAFGGMTCEEYERFLAVKEKIESGNF